MPLFINNEDISSQVESYIEKHGGEYIEAVLWVCDKNNIEPQIAAKYLSKPIIEKIEIEGRYLNLLPKVSAKLPI
tara:strand:+ start:759 stop:983 length:225 start_codon:yes stop_codon:yes gene_type:complete